MNKKIKKVVLAYSGGLDTSVIIPWLKENYDNCEVIAVVGDVGQNDELDGIEAKAIKSGASKIYIEDIKEEFVDKYILTAVKAGAKYESSYLLGTALARPIIAKKLVEVAKKENADAICHGCTGKGNDQVRFELMIKACMPEAQIIAPWRIWELKSREQEIEYAEKHNIPLKITKETNYSKDKNIWHLSHEGLDLENPENEPNYDRILEISVSPEKAPDVPTYVEIGFKKGKPVSIDGKKMKAIDILKKLNKIGGENGIGIIDMVENRLVGMKSRGVYETPGGTILYFAHQLLETICLDKDTMHYKLNLGNDFAKQIYEGKWETTLTKSMIAFVEETQKNVTGKVKIKLYKGNMIPAGIISQYSLYSEEIATFGEDDSYNQQDAEGFINLYGLPIKVKAEMELKMKGEK
ncbi:MAG: argininosuccinate synthase [Clostridia bacterium]